MERRFDIPIVLIIFKRKDTTLRIIERIKAVNPSKLYIISDEGRNVDEKKKVRSCRDAIENAIDWECEIIKNYADENRGVHAQIGLGAMWVFEKEESAIFLEDDNLPETTFFDYCEVCLNKYKNDERIFWVCGTNYLERSPEKNGYSVFASSHLMPCGWASWSWKFNKYYDYNLKLTNDPNWEKKLRKNYRSKALYKQQRRSIRNELERKRTDERYRSWDFHTVLSMRANNLFGIVPVVNQIENIGVDEFSTHGGTSFDQIMTERFCGISSYSFTGDVKVPDASSLEFQHENQLKRIILYPIKARIIMGLRELLGVPSNVRLREHIIKLGRVE